MEEERGNVVGDYFDLLKTTSKPLRVLRIVWIFIGAVGIVGTVVGLASGTQPPAWVAPVAKGAIALSVFAVFALFFAVPLYDLLKEQRRARTPAAFFDECLKRYGFMREAVKSTAQLNMHGAFVETTDIKVTTTWAKVRELAHFASSGETGGEPQDDVGTELRSYHYPGGEVEMIARTNGAKSSHWRVRFTPELQSANGGTASAEYQFVERCGKGSFLMTNAEVRSLPMHMEYWSINIKYPTKRLEMKVFLPFDAEKYDADCWCDKGTVRNAKERAQLTSCCRDGKTEDGKYYVALEVDYPVLGLTYAIKWRPPEPKKK